MWNKGCCDEEAGYDVEEGDVCDTLQESQVISKVGSAGMKL